MWDGFLSACVVCEQAEGQDWDLTDADLRPEALDQQRVEQLLAEHLHENNVAIITRNEFTEALRDFVDKVNLVPGQNMTAQQQCLFCRSGLPAFTWTMRFCHHDKG